MDDSSPDVPVPIRHYVDARFTDHSKEHAAEHRALDAAATATDDRLRAMNEFRNTISDQQRHFVTRETFDAIIDAQAHRLDAIAREGQRGAILAGTAAGVIGVIGGFVLSNFV